MASHSQLSQGISKEKPMDRRTCRTGAARYRSICSDGIFNRKNTGHRLLCEEQAKKGGIPLCFLLPIIKIA